MHSALKQKLVEKREYPRNRCSVNVEYSDDLETHREAIISDISPGGAFIDTQNFLGNGQDILMKVQLPGLPKPMAIIGEVVHHNSDGMGVKFNTGLGASAINSFVKSI